MKWVVHNGKFSLSQLLSGHLLEGGEFPSPSGRRIKDEGFNILDVLLMPGIK